MNRADRLRYKERLAEELAKRSWDEIDVILREFDFMTSDLWQGSDPRAYCIDMMRNGSDGDLLELEEYLNPPDPLPSLPDDAGPWEDGWFRLFLSHVSREKVFAQEVSRALRGFGIQGFVAHADIKPTTEWMTAIEVALATADGLAALLHGGFVESRWCDQEVGMAAARRIPLVPVKFSNNPHGFLGRVQAVQGSEDAHVVARAIHDSLSENPLTRSAIVDASLHALSLAGSFYEANSTANRLRGRDIRWTAERLDVLEDALKNPQVSDAFDAKPFIRRTLKAQRPTSPPPPDDDDVPF